MVYRKGELSKSMVDRRWPHQVALPACRCLGHKYLAILLRRAVALDARRQLRSAETALILTLSCLLGRQHAEELRERFGVSCSNAKSRPSGQE